MNDQRVTGKGPRARMRRHDWIGERSRALAAAVAEHIRRDPELLKCVRLRLERRIMDGSRRGRALEQEWLRLLDTLSLAALLDFLVEDSERATQLRQSSPFTGILSPEERDAIMRRFELM